MDRDYNIIFLILAIVASVASVGGFSIGYKLANETYRDQAIEAGVGQYHPQTGKFEFIKVEK